MAGGGGQLRPQGAQSRSLPVPLEALAQMSPEEQQIYWDLQAKQQQLLGGASGNPPDVFSQLSSMLAPPGARSLSKVYDRLFGKSGPPPPVPPQGGQR